MAATVHHASDVPNFEPNLPQLPTTPERELPGGDSVLEDRARQIGRW